MIHVLTLTWNGLDKLRRLKDGLVRNLMFTGHPAKWYIRDNGSTDGTKKWLEDWDKWNDDLNMEPMFVDHNRDNFAQCVNSLLYTATPKLPDKHKGNNIILLLNNDVEFIDNVSLSNMVKLFDKSKVGMVGARLLYNGTNKLQHAGVIFGKRYGNMPYHYRHQEESDKNAEKNRHFQAVTAACCLIHEKALADALKSGYPMDEKFSWAFEDIDLCLRIKEAGWKIAYCGETKIYHEESASLKKNPVNKMFLPQNVKHFKEKWFGKYDLDHEKYLKNPSYNEIK